ncbi:hypothetical protein AB4114_10920 [Paenibacillus sp. 2RAB27]|uniref:hypothetical protein n=1 Tax=Paenibacillus sp. 2RAB27 TaxID=3232991 RepID=UPI003F951221
MLRTAVNLILKPFGYALTDPTDVRRVSVDKASKDLLIKCARCSSGKMEGEFIKHPPVEKRFTLNCNNCLEEETFLLTAKQWRTTYTYTLLSVSFNFYTIDDKGKWKWIGNITH